MFKKINVIIGLNNSGIIYFRNAIIKSSQNIRGLFCEKVILTEAKADELIYQELFKKSKEIVQVAREMTGTVANFITVISNFEIGRYLVKEEQK